MFDKYCFFIRIVTFVIKILSIGKFSFENNMGTNIVRPLRVIIPYAKCYFMITLLS